jgi:hypothetical protein
MDHLWPLSQWILKIIHSERHGGRTLCTDENTVVLYDCGVWTEAHTQMVHNRYPECEVTVMQSLASLSGFIVLFKLHTDRSVYTWVTAVMLGLALILITARQIMVAALPP